MLPHVILQSKKRGLSLEEKRTRLLELFYEKVRYCCLQSQTETGEVQEITNVPPVEDLPFPLTPAVFCKLGVLPKNFIRNGRIA